MYYLLVITNIYFIEKCKNKNKFKSVQRKSRVIYLMLKENDFGIDYGL